MALSKIVMVGYAAYWIFLVTIVRGFEKRISELEKENSELRKGFVEARKKL